MRRAALETEGHAKEEIADDEEADLLEVVDPLVLHHQIEQSGQVRDRDEDEVGREAEERLGDDRHERGRRGSDGCVRRTGVVGEVERCAQGEQRGRHHDQQEVLDHVVAEVLHVEDADDRLRGDEGDDESREERRPFALRTNVPTRCAPIM